MGITQKLITYRRKPIFGRLANLLLKVVYSIEIPNNVIIGKDVKFIHSASGTIIRPDTVIEDSVKIFHQVTIGRADAFVDRKESKMEKIIIKKGAVLCAGAKVLCKEGTLVVGENTIIGANAVLTKSTGDNEVWVGIPAKKLSKTAIKI